MECAAGQNIQQKSEKRSEREDSGKRERRKSKRKERGKGMRVRIKREGEERVRERKTCYIARMH